MKTKIESKKQTSNPVGITGLPDEAGSIVRIKQFEGSITCGVD